MKASFQTVVKLLILFLSIRVEVCFSQVDSNADGVSDVWESRYGMASPSQSVDTDQDGESDLKEGLVGTDPHDSTSVFHLRVERLEQVSRYLRWSSKSGKRYQAQSLGTGGDWTDLGESVIGNGGWVGVADRAGADAMMSYRIQVKDEASFLPEIEAELAGRDTDGDGQDDWSEWRAGTSIIDPGDRFGLESVASDVSVVRFQWSTVEGVRYFLESLVDASWVRMEGDFHGDGGLAEYTTEFPGRSGIFRLVMETPDSDGDSLLDWEEALLGLDPGHPFTVDVIRRDDHRVIEDLNSGGDLTLETVRPVLNVTRGGTGAIRIRRSDGYSPLTVQLRMEGNAEAGVDYELLPESVEFSFGQTEVEIPIHLPQGHVPSGSKQLKITLLDSPSYELKGETEKTVSILVEDLLNVRDFGAVGDGVADDGPAIQRAFDELEFGSPKNGVYFPVGTYRLAKVIGDSSAPTGSWRLLKIGRQYPLTGRDIVVKGDPGTVFYSDVSPVRAHILIASATFRSLYIRNIRFEQESAPLWATPGNPPNGSDGVTVVRKDSRRVEAVTFEDCDFVNCHGAVWIHGRGSETLGQLGVVSFDRCKALNPYGSNTINGQTAWDGGVQFVIPSWVAEARYENCVLDGGGEDMTDATTSPGGVLKDGGHFGSPLRLVFRNNVVKRMGVEALFQTNENTFLGQSKTSFIMPPPDNLTETSFEVLDHPSAWLPGEIILIRSPHGPGLVQSNNYFVVRGFDSITRTVRVTNPGDPENAQEGTSFAAGRFIYRDDKPEPTHAIIEHNVFDGTIPPGGRAIHEQAAVSFQARSLIRSNLIRGFGRAVICYEDVHTPAHPAGRGTVIEDNVILTRDSSVYPTTYTFGINVWANDERIRGNLIGCPVSTKTVGVLANGFDTRVERNTIYSLVTVVNGYGSSVRGVGIGSGNHAKDLFGSFNSTRGFDVGIGPVNAYQAIPYRQEGHWSLNDVLPVDPTGLQAGE